MIAELSIVMIEKLVDLIKQQAKIFLLDAGEFYAFGTAISNSDQIIPLAVYVANEPDKPESAPLIELLSAHIYQGIANNEYKAAAIGIDVIIKEHGERFDAIQIQIFDRAGSSFQIVKYILSETGVSFGDVK